MNNNDFKILAKKYSKEILLDLICNQPISRDELSIYREEVKRRGLEEELSDMIKNKENRRNKIRESVKDLPEESLLMILVYNIDRYSEKDLTVFREEVKKRGLEEKLNTQIKEKEASDIEFKKSVIDSSNDANELMDNFNKHLLSRHPNLEKSIKKREEQALMRRIIGVIVFGVILFLLWKFF